MDKYLKITFASPSKSTEEKEKKKEKKRKTITKRFALHANTKNNKAAGGDIRFKIFKKMRAYI